MEFAWKEGSGRCKGYKESDGISGKKLADGFGI